MSDGRVYTVKGVWRCRHQPCYQYNGHAGPQRYHAGAIMLYQQEMR